MSAPGGTVPDRSLAAPDAALVDLFGNGLPCVLELNGTSRFWSNAGCGRFDFPRTPAFVPSTARLGDPGVQLADV
jgi:hypothetical protein